MFEDSPESSITLAASQALHALKRVGVSGFHFGFRTRLGDGLFKFARSSWRGGRRFDSFFRQVEHQSFFKPPWYLFRAKSMHGEMSQLMPQSLVQDSFSRQQLERLQDNGLAIARGRHPSGLSRSVDEFSHGGRGFNAYPGWQNLRVRAQFLSPLFQRIERLLHPGFLGSRVTQIEVFA